VTLPANSDSESIPTREVKGGNIRVPQYRNSSRICIPPIFKTLFAHFVASQSCLVVETLVPLRLAPARYHEILRKHVRTIKTRDLEPAQRKAHDLLGMSVQCNAPRFLARLDFPLYSCLCCAPANCELQQCDRGKLCCACECIHSINETGIAAHRCVQRAGALPRYIWPCHRVSAPLRTLPYGPAASVLMTSSLCSTVCPIGLSS
jgi:hypothetical protein